MSRRRSLKPIVVAAIVVLAAIAVLAWHGVAALADRVAGIEESQADAPAPSAPVPGGPGFHAESAFAFRPYDPGPNYSYSGAELYNPTGQDRAYEAPVSLPNGATITKLVAYYYDNAASDLHVAMAHIALDGSGTANMATVNPGGQPGYTHVETTSISYATVDQQNYSYVVQVTLPATFNVRLVGIRIDYMYAVNMPMVAK